jgi:hypothetical protein
VASGCPFSGADCEGFVQRSYPKAGSTEWLIGDGVVN